MSIFLRFSLSFVNFLAGVVLCIGHIGSFMMTAQFNFQMLFDHATTKGRKNIKQTKKKKKEKRN